MSAGTIRLTVRVRRIISKVVGGNTDGARNVSRSLVQSSFFSSNSHGTNLVQLKFLGIESNVFLYGMKGQLLALSATFYSLGCFIWLYSTKL